MATVLVGAREAAGVELRYNPNPAGVGKNPVGRPRKPIDAAKVRDLYVGQRLPLAKVAAELGVATLTLRTRMDELNIPVRKRGRPVKGARKLIGNVALDSEYTESPEAEAALTALLEAEQAEIEAAELEAAMESAKAEAEADAAGEEE